MVGLNFGYSGRRMRETKRVVSDRNLVPTAIPSVEGLAAHLAKLSPTLLDDGVETAGKPMTRRNTRANRDKIRKKHWRKMRTRLGAEGPLELVHRRLRDVRCRAIMRFRWAQFMTEGPDAHLLSAHERTRYMQMQAHAMQAMMEDPKPKPEKLRAAVVKGCPEFQAVMRFLWRAGAMAKTRTGLVSRYAYERLNYLLHYALLPNLLHADEAFASARADWERDVARSANEWPVDPEDMGGDDSVEGDPTLYGMIDPVAARADAPSPVRVRATSNPRSIRSARSPLRFDDRSRPRSVPTKRHQSFASAESDFRRLASTGAIVVKPSLPPASSFRREPGTAPAAGGLSAALARGRARSTTDLSLLRPKQPLAESALDMFRRRVPPQIDDAVLKRNKILDQAPVLLRYVVD